MPPACLKEMSNCGAPPADIAGYQNNARKAGLVLSHRIWNREDWLQLTFPINPRTSTSPHESRRGCVSGGLGGILRPVGSRVIVAISGGTLFMIRDWYDGLVSVSK